MESGTCFEEQLARSGRTLIKGPIEILQVNLGRLCNLTCSHCHVEAGPAKTQENLGRETAEAVIRFLEQSGIRTLDLTGGAPEMNPFFDFIVTRAHEFGVHVIDHCNLTVLMEPGREDLAAFLAGKQAEITASLPCYQQENVDHQRGKGVLRARSRPLRN